MKEKNKKAFGTAFTTVGILFCLATFWSSIQGEKGFASLFGLIIGIILILIGLKLQPDITKVFK